VTIAGLLVLRSGGTGDGIYLIAPSPAPDAAAFSPLMTRVLMRVRRTRRGRDRVVVT